MWTIYQWRSRQTGHHLRYVTANAEGDTAEEALERLVEHERYGHLYWNGYYIVVHSGLGNWQGGMFQVRDRTVTPVYTEFDGAVTYGQP